MKSTMLTPLMAHVTALIAALAILVAGSANAQTVVKPRPAPPGNWTLIGATVASDAADHDSIIVRGRNDNFSKLMFKVTEASLNMHRIVVTYDNGEPEEIHVRHKIPKGGKSRAVDLRGGTRSIRRIDFWYDTRGSAENRAVVTVFGKN